MKVHNHRKRLLVKGLTTIAAVLGASLALWEPASAAEPPACSSSVPVVLQFRGLPSRVVIGKEEEYGYSVDNSDPAARYVGPIGASTYSAHGRLIQSENELEPGDTTFVRLRLTDRFVTVKATYTVQAGAQQCSQAIERRVRAIRHIYVAPWFAASRPYYKPRLMVLGASRPQLRGLRWRHWNSGKARARGTYVTVACPPVFPCAEAPVIRRPVRATLYRRKLCAKVERYVYTRLRYIEGGRAHKFSLPCRAFV